MQGRPAKTAAGEEAAKPHFGQFKVNRAMAEGEAGAMHLISPWRTTQKRVTSED